MESTYVLRLHHKVMTSEKNLFALAGTKKLREYIKRQQEVKIVHFFFNKKGETNKNLIEQIILEKYNQYYCLAYSYVHNEADAYDIVQNGVYKALKGSHTLKKPEYAETWVYRIMLNECFRYLKQPKLLSYESIQDENKGELGYTDDAYENIELQQALDSLSAQDKAVIILRFFEDRKLEEIAEILEENVSTVKSRLYRSMKKLYHVLATDINQGIAGLNNGMEDKYGL